MICKSNGLIGFLLTIVSLFGTSANSLYSQIEFKGTILSESENKPIAFASIGVKGKRAGVVADVSGKGIPDR